MEQIGIMVFGVAAIWLLSRREKWRRWGFICGICSQPFWFWTTVKNEQWGIFVLAFFFTYSWLNGIWNYWIRPGTKDGV